MDGEPVPCEGTPFPRKWGSRAPLLLPLRGELRGAKPLGSRGRTDQLLPWIRVDGVLVPWALCVGLIVFGALTF